LDAELKKQRLADDQTDAGRTDRADPAARADTVQPGSPERGAHVAERGNVTPLGKSLPSGDADQARAVPGSRSGAVAWLKWSLLQLARTILPILIIVGAVAAYQYMKATRPVPPQRPAQETTYPVKAVAARVEDVRPRLTLYGVTVAGREVDMRALVAGRVIDTGADLREGARISRGDMLLKIDPFDYESSIRETEAQIDEARARIDEFKASITSERDSLKFAREQLRLAKADLTRAQTLSRRGNIAERSVDDRSLVVSQREQTVNQKLNNVRVFEARIKQQEAAIARLSNTLSRNRQRLSETTLNAPFDAYVTDVGAQVGRMLSVNDKVATLIDRSWIDVRFTLTDRQYGRLLKSVDSLIGREIDVDWSIGSEAVSYTATVDRVAARVTTGSGGVDVYARIERPDGEVAVRPGAFVELRLDDVLYESVVSLPASAVYDNRKVFLIEEDRLRELDVNVVATSGERLLVRGDIDNGDRVLATRLSTPGTGIKVEVR